MPETETHHIAGRLTRRATRARDAGAHPAHAMRARIPRTRHTQASAGARPDQGDSIDLTNVVVTAAKPSSRYSASAAAL
ncbi:Uncharacterised protein [Burkholderia pseudomallei]|nr:Uncharacterised protein [Burkholderia pseudomallei]CAJ2844038.1 Uncharacterised protein [Burkholderia pseudomallei]CAJ2850935.1 Uncharacterised protein [Burkholderia pseudomallei]CAJ2864399.1 Uncharacterised protein [Burkholderia pseudomallei]CAJ2868606.1 Uncharacterised protein [Burkholderia pseudomallei]